MKVFYFCTCTIVRHICGIMGKGKSCSQIVGCDLLRRRALIGTLLCHCYCLSAQQAAADSVLLNDVIAGAGVGILSTRMAYWLLPWERKLLRWDKKSLKAAIIPAFQYDTKTFSISLNAQL